MIGRYLMEAGIIYSIIYVLICSAQAKQYKTTGEKVSLWVLALLMSIPGFAFWASIYSILRALFEPSSPLR
jgi:MFS-type transporter involved in bile tolerance (Atg22 family)